MVGLRRSTLPYSTTTNQILVDSSTSSSNRENQSAAQGGGSTPTSNCIMTGLRPIIRPADQSTTTVPSPSSVWRKTSHPPIYFNNNEMRNRNLQLQLRNRGTKDDWGASLRYDIEDPQPSTTGKLSESEESESTSAPETPSPSLFERFILLSDNLKSLIRCIMDEAKRSVSAELCSLFLVDDEKKELTAQIFDQLADEGITEQRVPLDNGIVGKVIGTRSTMNVKDVHRCPFFNPLIDEITGFHTRNILCFPIVDNAGTLIGVIELCNKIGDTSFTKHDEKYCKAFAVYCANSISHCIFYKKISEIQTRCHMAEEWMVQQPQSVGCVDEADVRRLVADPLRDFRYFSEHFDNFSFAPRQIGDAHFHKASLMFFEDLGFTIRYRINKRKLARLVLRISAGYRSVPYHNWSHAFAVAHFCWLMMRTEACQQALTELERLSLMIACLCHDIDHRGTTNSFQLQSKTPLAQLYSSEGSVLERHHYAQTVLILHESDCDILEQLTAVEYRIVLSHIREIILATDIAAHLKKAPRIQEMVRVGYDPISVDHHYLLTCLIMTASDLSDQSKNFRNAKFIAENIYKEFFAQGDLETELGVKPLEMMDRQKAYVPQVQLEFLDSIGLPVFEMLASIIPDGKSTYEAICANRLCWKTLHEQMMNCDEKVRHGLDYLRDEQIEQMVFEKVRKIDTRAATLASKTFKPAYTNGLVAPKFSAFDRRYDGYLLEYQDPDPPPPPLETTTTPDESTSSSKQQTASKLGKVRKPFAWNGKDAEFRQAAHNDEASSLLLKPTTTTNTPTNDMASTTRRATRTPQRLWRRARRIMSSCASCSPISSRRNVSEDSDSG